MPIATDPLSRVFFALADPTRRAMLDRLAHGPATVGELAEPFAISRPAVSQHLRVLGDAGLVSRAARGTRRSCSIEPEALDTASAWVASNRAAWHARFDRLDDVLVEIRSGITTPDGVTTVDDAATDTDHEPDPDPEER